MALSPFTTKNRYLCKASWPATALRFWVDAIDEADAMRKAERMVRGMEGYLTCTSIELVNPS